MPDKIDQYRSKLERELVVAKNNISGVFSSSSTSNEKTNDIIESNEKRFNTYLKGMGDISHFLLQKNVGGETMQATFNFLEQFSATYMKVESKINETTLAAD